MTRHLLTTGALVVLLAFTAPAHADERPLSSFLQVPEPESRGFFSLPSADLELAAGLAGDLLSTEMMLAHGWAEKNPLAQSRGYRLVGAVAEYLLFTWLRDVFEAHGHHTLAKLVVKVPSSIHWSLTQHNAHLAEMVRLGGSTARFAFRLEVRVRW